MSNNPHLSPSQLELMAKCGQAWKFRYIDGLRLKPRAAMIVGSGVDDSVNANLGNKIETQELLDANEVVEIARDGVVNRWDEEGCEIPEGESESDVKGKAIDTAVTLAGTHHQVLAPTIEPTHVQRDFRIHLEGFGVDLVGILDIQEGEKRVRDTKTTRRSVSANAKDADESPQLTMYALAVKVADGKPPEEVTLDFLMDRSRLKKDKTPKIQTLTSTRDEKDFQPLLNRVEAAIKVMESGIVTPAPPGSWWCSKEWCGYWNVCPFVR